VSAGAVLHEQKRAACLAAIEHDCAVTFVHNSRQYRIVPADLLTQVHEQER
jgi:hypothetical protein